MVGYNTKRCNSRVLYLSVFPRLVESNIEEIKIGFCLKKANI